MLAHVGGKVERLHRDRFGALTDTTHAGPVTLSLSLTLPLTLPLTPTLSLTLILSLSLTLTRCAGRHRAATRRHATPNAAGAAISGGHAA